MPGLAEVPDTPEADLAAFDQLGPKTRAVINFDLGVKWSSSKTLEMARQMRLNPLKPADDARLAAMLRTANVQILQRLAVIDQKADLRTAIIAGK